MSEMIERVARALHKSEYPLGSYEGFRTHTPDGARFERMARAALEAMREPTPDMRIAGGIAWSEALNAETYVDNADVCFKAMIDAALGKVDA